jgi:acetoin utilization protein AcuB
MTRKTIQAYMTPSPHTIGKDQTIADARKWMKEYKIRHLPVLDGGRLAGILSDRDVALVSNLGVANADDLTVEEAMSSEVFSVAPSAALDEVTERMASKKYGAAVVVDSEKVVGVFTAIDALHVLTDLLRAS